MENAFIYRVCYIKINVLKIILVDPPPVIENFRINSPHYLCKLMVKEPGVQKYTLVIAQVFFFLNK